MAADTFMRVFEIGKKLYSLCVYLEYRGVKITTQFSNTRLGNTIFAGIWYVESHPVYDLSSSSSSQLEVKLLSILPAGKRRTKWKTFRRIGT
ncbi:hypothetical protein U1Q18_052027, partial [Sarracenia purpurea var. burkii]